MRKNERNTRATKEPDKNNGKEPKSNYKRISQIKPRSQLQKSSLTEVHNAAITLQNSCIIADKFTKWTYL